MKVKVDHTGICLSQHFTAGVVTDLSEEAVLALGSHAQIMEQPQPKQQQPKQDKMMKNAPINKNV